VGAMRGLSEPSGLLGIFMPFFLYLSFLMLFFDD